MSSTPLRPLRRRLIFLLVFYFFAGSASQKLIPGIDEIFPLFGWSLFSKVPDLDTRYTLLLHSQDGRPLEPPVTFFLAPEDWVKGNRYIARKVIQKLGQAQDRGQAAGVAHHREILEHNYLRGQIRYELVFEKYSPLEKWREGKNREARTLAFFESGVIQ